MNQERLLKVIISPHLSEKASIATEKRNAYVFEVERTATKSEVKDAIEFLFSVKVHSVNLTSVKAKKKTFKGMAGKKKAWKKAYVTLQPDHKIALEGAA